MDTNKEQRIQAEAARIYAALPREEVFKTYFKNWGTKNMWSDEKWDAYLLANAIHNLDKAANPEDHQKMPQKQHWRCWEEDNCSCGFCSSCDSSD